MVIHAVKHEGAWDWSYGWGRTDTTGFDPRANNWRLGILASDIWDCRPVVHSILALLDFRKSHERLPTEHGDE